MPPSVSILIPCYNAEPWIGDAIDSALAQTHPDTEVVVYDDGSTDASVDVIRQYGDRIHWDSGPNRGGGSARNWLLENAEKEWIQYLDADDYLEPDKVKEQADAIASGKVAPDADVVYGPVTFQHHEGETIRREVEPIQHPDDPWASLVTWDLPQTGSPLWRKSALLDVNGWKDDQPVCQEHELYLRLLKADTTFEYHPSGGAVYRHWSDQTVCRADEARTYRYRLAITKDAEAFMREHDLMTPARREALDRAYLSCARIIWTFDRNWAKEIMRHAVQNRTSPLSLPSDAVPTLYRWLFRTIGFSGAEQVASWKRKLIS